MKKRGKTGFENSISGSTKQHSNFRNTSSCDCLVLPAIFFRLCSFLRREPEKVELRFDLFRLDRKRNGENNRKEKLRVFQCLGVMGNRV